MTCLLVEGSSCALDLVCVLLPHSVIGSRLLAAACAGGLQPGRNLSVASHGEISPTPNRTAEYRTAVRRSGVVVGEFWAGGYFVLARAAPAAISGVLSCLFVHYPCIIRQTIIPLCFASVVQMLTGNESPQAGGRVGVTISQLFIACPTGIKVSRLKSPFAEREKAVFWCRGKEISLFYEDFSGAKASGPPPPAPQACVIASHSGHF